jgi:hypothetical protein
VGEKVKRATGGWFAKGCTVIAAEASAQFPEGTFPESQVRTWFRNAAPFVERTGKLGVVKLVGKYGIGRSAAKA